MRGREVQGFCFSAAYGHVSPNAGSETLVASSTMPPVTVWNASVARPLLSFVDSAGVRGICILFQSFEKIFFFSRSVGVLQVHLLTSLNKTT